jgi:hypothetical protein
MGRIDIVRLLLEKGADVNAIARLGQTNMSALTLAESQNHPDIAELLRSRGAQSAALVAQAEPVPSARNKAFYKMGFFAGLMTLSGGGPERYDYGDFCRSALPLVNPPDRLHDLAQQACANATLPRGDRKDRPASDFVAAWKQFEDALAGDDAAKFALLGQAAASVMVVTDPLTMIARLSNRPGLSTSAANLQESAKREVQGAAGLCSLTDSCPPAVADDFQKIAVLLAGPGPDPHALLGLLNDISQHFGLTQN